MLRVVPSTSRCMLGHGVPTSLFMRSRCLAVAWPVFQKRLFPIKRQDLFKDEKGRYPWSPYLGKARQKYIYHPSENLPETFLKPGNYTTAEELTAHWASYKDVQELFDDFEQMEHSELEWNCLLQRLADLDMRFALKYVPYAQWNGVIPNAKTLNYLCDRAKQDEQLWLKYEEVVRDRPLHTWPFYLRTSGYFGFFGMLMFLFGLAVFESWWYTFFGSEQIMSWGISRKYGDYLPVGHLPAGEMLRN